MRVLTLMSIFIMLIIIAGSCGPKPEKVEEEQIGSEWVEREQTIKPDLAGKKEWVEEQLYKKSTSVGDMVDLAEYSWRSKFLVQTARDIIGYCEWYQKKYGTVETIERTERLENWTVTLLDRSVYPIPEYNIGKVMYRKDYRGIRIHIYMDKDDLEEYTLNQIDHALDEAKKERNVLANSQIEASRVKYREYKERDFSN